MHTIWNISVPLCLFVGTLYEFMWCISLTTCGMCHRRWKGRRFPTPSWVRATRRNWTIPTRSQRLSRKSASLPKLSDPVRFLGCARLSAMAAWWSRIVVSPHPAKPDHVTGNTRCTESACTCLFFSAQHTPTGNLNENFTLTLASTFVLNSTFVSVLDIEKTLKPFRTRIRDNPNLYGTVCLRAAEGTGQTAERVSRKAITQSLVNSNPCRTPCLSCRFRLVIALCSRQLSPNALLKPLFIQSGRKLHRNKG